MEHGTVLYETSVNFFETIAAYQIDACGHSASVEIEKKATISEPSPWKREIEVKS